MGLIFPLSPGSAAFVKKLIILIIIILLFILLHRSIAKVKAADPKALKSKFAAAAAYKYDDKGNTILVSPGSTVLANTPPPKEEVSVLQNNNVILNPIYREEQNPKFLFLIDNNKVPNVYLRDRIDVIFATHSLDVHFDRSFLNQPFTEINASFPYTVKDPLPYINLILKENIDKIKSEHPPTEIYEPYKGKFNFLPQNKKDLPFYSSSVESSSKTPLIEEIN